MLLPQNGWALVINQKRTRHLTCRFSEENTAQTDIFKGFFFCFFFTKTALTNVRAGLGGISGEEILLHTHTHAARTENKPHL